MFDVSHFQILKAAFTDRLVSPGFQQATIAFAKAHFHGMFVIPSEVILAVVIIWLILQVVNKFKGKKATKHA